MAVKEFISNLTGEVVEIPQGAWDKMVADAVATNNYFGHKAKASGTEIVFEEWAKQKGHILNFMRSLPDYDEERNGVGRYIIEWDYVRPLQFSVVIDVCYWLKNASVHGLEAAKLPFSYHEVDNIIYNLRNIIGHMDYLPGCIYNGNNIEYYRNERKRYISYRDDMSLKYPVVNGKFISPDSYKRYKYFCEIICKYFERDTERIATNDCVDEVNQYFPDIRAGYGMKKTRLLGKLVEAVNINDSELNRQLVRFGDAITPLTKKVKFIISVNPLDYLTGSFLNGCGSCHTIDNHNIREVHSTQIYGGMHAAGNISYMIDQTTIITYEPSSKPEPWAEEIGLEGWFTHSKNFRCLFHETKGSMIQSRMYPQSMDEDEDDAGRRNMYRHFMQDFCANMNSLESNWKLKKYEDTCMSHYYQTMEGSAQYPDYSYSYNNTTSVSLNKNIAEYKRIQIGHAPLCMCCGREYHDNDYGVVCRRCNSGQTNDPENDILAYCERCGDPIYESDDYVYTEDDRYFCSCNCAERYDYIEVDGSWYYCDNVTYCDSCGSHHLDEDCTYIDHEDRYVCDSCLEENYVWVESISGYAHINDVVTCDQCGEAIMIESSSTLVDDDGNHFCSEECYDIYHTEEEEENANG